MTPTADAYDAIAAANARLDRQRFPVLCPERKQVSESLKALFTGLAASGDIGTAFEIGAFEATFSRTLASGETPVRAVAFEANPEVWAHFRDDVVATGAEYLNFAVSNRPGVIELNVPASVKGREVSAHNRMSSIHKQKLGDVVYRTLEAPTTSLDGWLKDNPRPGPYAMWIDVEGAQETILEAATEALKQTSFVLIELENSTIWEGQAAADAVKSRLTDAGFVGVARDIERPHQFNGLFVKPDALKNADVAGRIEAWRLATFDILAGMK